MTVAQQVGSGRRGRRTAAFWQTGRARRSRRGGCLFRVRVVARTGMYGPGQVEDLLRDVEQLRFCLSSSCTVIHCWLAITCRFASARFWLIITNVERKIASSDTIIVSSPYG